MPIPDTLDRRATRVKKSLRSHLELIDRLHVAVANGDSNLLQVLEDEVKQMEEAFLIDTPEDGLRG